MATVTLRGIPVSFPFKPYDIQKAYMEKVIECLQTETNGVLESPTGTGKTLSLLCSSLAWLTVQKAKAQAEIRLPPDFVPGMEADEPSQGPSKLRWDIPTIIYASRTHSQLTQAMQELKRTSYSHVHSTVVGSRDQLCIHPDVMQQQSNSAKIVMCQAMVKARSCYLQNRVEKMSTDRSIVEMNIADIEDLVKLGLNRKFCPYYMTKELKKNADIIFLPYNYLLDPKARRANQLDLRNSVIILDEAHNVEKVCEDSASFQLKTTDIALCIEEVTQVMKFLENGGNLNMDVGDSEKDFDAEQLANFKQILINLEEVIDKIDLGAERNKTFGGKHIFQILKDAGIDDSNHNQVLGLLDILIQFLNTTAKENPFQRSGAGIQLLQDMLLIVFQKVTQEFKDRIEKCYKVHLSVEEDSKNRTLDSWSNNAKKSKLSCRVLSYWCFSPNFGMQMLLEQGVRCVILTSGTLAPLKPLISELGIKIGVRLENPHVVDHNQIFVRILSAGPDGTPLNSGFQNRDNQKYVNSLGFAIINLSRQIPNGLLIFFPSYAVLSKCQENWQQSGIWTSMNQLKLIYVEPRTKDAFNSVMQEFYSRIKNPDYQGATFMAVCRGKVSEGLDFADINGRAVIITGLPYPPFKDPRVVLKRKYLDACRSKDSEYVSGQDWYGLEATRAVNQAIGRVIRHRHDYGAILLLDSRFNNFHVKNQLSLWIRDHVKQAKHFGEIIRDMRTFFKNASEFILNSAQSSASTVKPGISSHQQNLKVKLSFTTCEPCQWSKTNSKSNNFELLLLTCKLIELSEFMENYDTLKENQKVASAIQSCSTVSNEPEVKIYNKIATIIIDSDSDNSTKGDGKRRLQNQLQNENKRKRINKKILIKADYFNEEKMRDSKEDAHEYINTMKTNLDAATYKIFISALTIYKDSRDFSELTNNLNKIFLPKPHLRYLIQGMMPYIKENDRENFIKYWEGMR